MNPVYPAESHSSQAGGQVGLRPRAHQRCLSWSSCHIVQMGETVTHARVILLPPPPPTQQRKNGKGTEDHCRRSKLNSETFMLSQSHAKLSFKISKNNVWLRDLKDFFSGLDLFFQGKVGNI